MEEELQYNEEAMKNVEKIAINNFEMIEEIALMSIEKFAATIIYDNIPIKLVEMLGTIDIALANVFGSNVENLDELLSILDGVKGIIINGIESTFPSINNNSDVLTCLDFIHYQLLFIDILEKYKKSIKKFVNLLNNDIPILIKYNDDEFELNKDIDWTNNNISAIVNIYYCIQDVYINSKKIKEVLGY